MENKKDETKGQLIAVTGSECILDRRSAVVGYKRAVDEMMGTSVDFNQSACMAAAYRASKGSETDPKVMEVFLAGAKWQHSQNALLIAALQTKIRSLESENGDLNEACGALTSVAARK